MLQSKFIFTLSLLGALLLSTGCASIVSDSSYNVKIDNKEDQKIAITNEKGDKIYNGTGSQSLDLKAGGGFNCMDYMIESPCGTTDIKAGIDGWVFGNIIFGGILGLIVDPITGAACTLPDSVSVADCDLVTDTAASSAESASTEKPLEATKSM